MQCACCGLGCEAAGVLYATHPVALHLGTAVLRWSHADTAFLPASPSRNQVLGRMLAISTVADMETGSYVPGAAVRTEKVCWAADIPRVTLRFLAPLLGCCRCCCSCSYCWGLKKMCFDRC